MHGKKQKSNPEERLQCAQECKQQYEADKTWLRRLFFLDQKTIVVQPSKSRHEKRWGILGCPDEDALTYDCGAVNEMVEIKFYSCVNLVFGPIDLKETTKTTGLRDSKDSKQYEVSAHIPVGVGKLLHLVVSSTWVTVQ